jgi:hypothetical protein
MIHEVQVRVTCAKQLMEIQGQLHLQLAAMLATKRLDSGHPCDGVSKRRVPGSHEYALACRIEHM